MAVLEALWVLLSLWLSLRLLQAPAQSIVTGIPGFFTLHFTVENVNATLPEHAWEPEFYEEYDFRVDALGACTEGPDFYFSKHDACSGSYYAFHLEPGETTEFEVSYLVRLENVPLESVVFQTADTKNGGPWVDLNLK